jgi:hypothetical protein
VLFGDVSRDPALSDEAQVAAAVEHAGVSIT